VVDGLNLSGEPPHVARRQFAMIALTTSLLMWLVAFLDVGGEWFLMWQSKMWNGQEEAFRMFTIVGVVFLVVVQREPTPD
jgi:predicted small integral membrane protein